MPLFDDPKKFESIFGKPTGERGVVYRRKLRGDPTKRSKAIPCPMVQSDTMDDLKSMADGKHYDSKSAYHKSLAEQGLHVVEQSKGDFMKPKEQPEISVSEVKKAHEQSIAELNR